ncbi:MAG: hypothetical protein ABW352_23185 [Polyangiales bacterium]
MRMNRSSMGLLFALGALVACSDEGDGVNDSQESLRRGQLADGGSVQGRRDRDDDTDEATEEALEGDGGKRRGRDHDEGDGGKGRGRGRFGGFFADGGCRGPRGAFGGGRDDRDDQEEEDAQDDERGPRGGKGPGGKGPSWSFDGGVAP